MEQFTTELKGDRMEFTHLKFLLRLSDLPNGRSKLAAISFREFEDKAQISQDLANDGLIAFDGAPVAPIETVVEQPQIPQVFDIKKVETVGIAPTGQELLKLDSNQLPIAEGELKVLEELAKTGKMLKPTEIAVKVGTKKLAAGDRNIILEKLHKSGLITASFKPEKVKKPAAPKATKAKPSGEFQITAKGQDCLQKLHDYFESLRKSPTSDLSNTIEVETVAPLSPKISEKISDPEILQLIRELDTEAGADNYLPIFYLRERLLNISRENLDRILYSLVRHKKIKLNALLHTEKYTQKQISAGISQLSGGPLFFIRVVTN
jgi:hypothetical protein